MNEKQKAKIIIKTLNKIYPKAPVPLKSKNTFTLLISVLLSAQCTDVNVNNVTKDIYPKYFKPEHFVKLGRKKIEKLIKKIGIFRIKAKSIYLMSKQVLEKHNGKVPKTFEELQKGGIWIYPILFFAVLSTLIAIYKSFQIQFLIFIINMTAINCTKAINK